MDPIVLTASQCKISTTIWDLDWLNEPEIRLLAKRFPMAGPFVYQAICCEIGTKGGFLRKDLLEAIADQTTASLEAVSKIVEYCANLDILQVTEHGITSRRMQREIEKTLRMKLSKKLKGDPILIFPWSSAFDLGSTLPDLGSETSDPSKERRGEERSGEVKERKGEGEQSGYLVMDPIALEQLKVSQGAEVVARAIQLAEAHIEKQRHIASSDYKRLVQEAKSGIAFLKTASLSIARQQLDNEAASASRKSRASPPTAITDEKQARLAKFIEETDGWTGTK